MALSLARPHGPTAEHDGHRLGRPTWAMERGANCWSAVADVAGAFPGFARQGGLLLGSRVRITERYLLVDEGRSHGFGLPLATVSHLAIGAADITARPKAALHLSYRDGATERCFLLRPRADRFGWPRDRFDQALRAFAQAGQVPAATSPRPSVQVSWEAARRFRDENVIWSGRVTAPLDALGLHRASADLWLTTRSLMWSAGAEPGINRVPIDRVIDVVPAELADQATTPALVVGYETDEARRRDLIFIFDRHLPPERNGRERGAIVVSFRSRGIALGALPGIHQPWRRDWWPSPAATADAATASPEAPTANDASPSPPEPLSLTPPAPVLLSRTRAFEAEALALLAEASARADDRLPAGDYPVLAASLGAALAELEAAELNGMLSGEQAAFRRGTLLTLSEAGSRLRALVRLCASGQISVERLHERRQAILEPLNRLLLGRDDAPPESAQADIAPPSDQVPR